MFNQELNKFHEVRVMYEEKLQDMRSERGELEQRLAQAKEEYDRALLDDIEMG